MEEFIHLIASQETHRQEVRTYLADEHNSPYPGEAEGSRWFINIFGRDREMRV